MAHTGVNEWYRLYGSLERLASSRFFLGLKVPRATYVELAQAALTEHKNMLEAQTQLGLKWALKHLISKMKDHLYSYRDKVLVWRETDRQKSHRRVYRTTLVQKPRRLFQDCSHRLK